jgi:multimeric flavodoxin WrbA
MMKILVISTSSNLDGLTAACAAAAVQGVKMAAAEAEEVRLNNLKVGLCEACGDGWGDCREIHECRVKDDFQALHARVIASDGIVLVTPVYWGEMSESAKAFTDRLRRCEATRGDDSTLKGKPFIAVAAAGGSGNGTMSCLASMERWIQHIRGRVFDLIPVNRWSRSYKLESINAAAIALVIREDLK